jgi:hypothetical protein
MDRETSKIEDQLARLSPQQRQQLKRQQLIEKIQRSHPYPALDAPDVRSRISSAR